MQIDLYGLQDNPFQMTPDARLYYASSVHSRAYAHLTYGLAQREGFVVITGEVGAGKTTLVERLCAELDPAGFAVARIMTTQVSGEDLLRLVADAFGAPPEGDKAAVLRGVIARLRAAERRHLLIVDEAQALPHPALEELRMLSNVTDGSRALLQTILLGQPELRRIIAAPELDQLRQRVLAAFHLSGLSPEETRSYIVHRLRAVGWDGAPAWDEAGFELVHRFTGGIPRRINRLCARVLLAGTLEQAAVLTASMVEATALELEEDLGGGAPPPARRAVEGTDRDYAIRLALQDAESEATHAELIQITQRLDALERAFARRERVFHRLMDLFADGSVRR
jgi:type II secretory pathway predicted ATPase ExeA